MPASSFMVCELTAPQSVLQERVVAREPNEYWQKRLLQFVELYGQRTDNAELRDFQIATQDKTIDSTAQEVIEKVGWKRH
jgi:hypothetical protein